MTREFRLSAGLDVAEESERRKKKTSFRGAAIAIIAANRLNRLVGKKSVMQRREVDLPSMQEFPLDPLLQCSHRRGGPSTVFVSPAEVLVRADEEIWISPEDGDAYNFVKLVEHFDASDPSAQHLGLGSCDGLRGVQGYDLDLLDSIRGAFPRAQHRRIQVQMWLFVFSRGALNRGGEACFSSPPPPHDITDHEMWTPVSIRCCAGMCFCTRGFLADVCVCVCPFVRVCDTSYWGDIHL